jgi:hypothetical protein
LGCEGGAGVEAACAACDDTAIGVGVGVGVEPAGRGEARAGVAVGVVLCAIGADDGIVAGTPYMDFVNALCRYGE